MTKFLDKKERVIDFQLTPYGKHRLSVGQLRPAYYAFFDTGVVYDSKYAGYEEIQNKIHERIKTETQFIEGVLLFEEAENSVPPGQFIGEGLGEVYGVLKRILVDGIVVGYEFLDFDDEWITGQLEVLEYWGYGTYTPEMLATMTRMEKIMIPGIFTLARHKASLFDLDISPARHIPKPEILSFESAIGDAKFEGDNTQAAPAWKVISCQGEMSNIKIKDTTDYALTAAGLDMESKEFNIPQIDVDAYYTLLISSPTGLLQQETISEFVSETDTFSDGNTIKLERDDIVIYGEEVNTELLTENFDIDVYEIIENTGTQASSTGTITMVQTPDHGDTITINDGVTSATFEFIDEATEAGGPSSASGDNIGVVVPEFYYIQGTLSNRKGALLNLVSAINQDSGAKSLGYPTDAGTGTKNLDNEDYTAGSRGRCKPLFDDNELCYDGNHNLNVSIDIGQIKDIANLSAPFTVKINNNTDTLVNPEADIHTAMTLSDSDSDMMVRGFGISSGGTDGYVKRGTQLKRKFFNDTKPQIVDGYMIAATPEAVQTGSPSIDSVEYFFDILTDSKVNGKIACSCANTFNKNSYYIDIDFDCVEEIVGTYYDIYGSSTAPEICNMPPVNFDELQQAGVGNDDICEDE